MTLSTLTLPRYIEFTSGGDPLAGGKIYFFEGGTSTPKDTFSDAAGSTPNANPVVLDANGRATIFMNNDGLYKIRVDDSTDVTIYEQDDYGANFGVMLSNAPVLLANMDTNGFSLVTTSGNKDMPIAPHGSGRVPLKNLQLSTVLYTNGFAIVSESNADITITPDGTGKAVINSVEEYYNLRIVSGTVEDTTYDCIIDAPEGFDIKNIRAICQAGSCVATVKIGGVALGGNPNTVTTATGTEAHSSANTVVAGGNVTVTVSSAVACSGLYLKYEARGTL